MLWIGLFKSLGKPESLCKGAWFVALKMMLDMVFVTKL
jgi:hypothetical protein